MIFAITPSANLLPVQRFFGAMKEPIVSLRIFTSSTGLNSSPHSFRTYSSRGNVFYAHRCIGDESFLLSRWSSSWLLFRYSMVLDESCKPSPPYIKYSSLSESHYMTSRAWYLQSLMLHIRHRRFYERVLLPFSTTLGLLLAPYDGASSGTSIHRMVLIVDW